PGEPPVGAVYDRARAAIEAVNEWQSGDIPLLASPRGGVAEQSRKCREASAVREAGVVSRPNGRKTTPAASASVASLNLIDDAATPPCGDARRGIYSMPIRSHLHTPPLQFL